ncbi:MAG: LarC family nickel insertion protein [Chloroflexi bacterium]|nr:LarC family nickel insertion protein [Chloroflexota bacterium]
MPANILYVDCFSGASGDMLLGAMIDAGLGVSILEQDLARLGLSDYELRVERRVRQGISGVHVFVHDHGQDRPAHNLSAVRGVIEQSGLPDDVVANSLRVFERLAEAEARIHGSDVEEVHFHEIGAVDSLIDIVGFCVGLHRLEIGAVYASPLPLGYGTVCTEHGELPVPAPATLALLAAAGAPVLPSKANTELVTPTGAALLTTLATFCQPAMRVRRVGYGFGTKELPWPNMLRLWVGEELELSSCGCGHHEQEHVAHTHVHAGE